MNTVAPELCPICGGNTPDVAAVARNTFLSSNAQGGVRKGGLARRRDMPKRRPLPSPPTRRNARPEPRHDPAPWTEEDDRRCGLLPHQRRERVFISSITHLEVEDWPTWVVEEHARRWAAR